MTSLEEEPILQGSATDEESASAPRIRSQFWQKVTVFCILATEVCERLTFFSITGNLVIFATNELGYTSVQAITINLLFVGTYHKRC